MNLSQPYQRLAFILLVALLPFAFTRLALLLSYDEVFQNLSLGEIAFAFVYGLRFDASVIIKFVGFPLLFIMLPFAWARSRWWQAFWHWMVFLGLAMLVLLLVGDFIYFGFVNRHVGAEIALLAGDTLLMWDIAVSEHGTALLLFGVLAVVLALVWHNLFRHPMQPNRLRRWQWLATLALFLVFVIIGRGGLQYKPVGVVDAFAGGSPASGYLALNGAFAAQYALARGNPKVPDFMPKEKAVSLLREQVRAPGDEFLDDAYPALRRNTSAVAPQQKPNIVVIMFESWDAKNTDVLRKLGGKKVLGVTPQFDALSEQGRLYTNFYANGRRSMDGLAAVLASMLTLPQMPYIGKGMELNHLSFMGSLAESQGYETFFLQSSKRNSFHVDAIATSAGFEHYLGAEDIPNIAGHADTDSDWGTWDYLTFMHANDLFAQADKPFLGFIFTSTTHNPWRVPKVEWEKFPAEEDFNRYLNTLAYADWSLGEFMQKAKQAGYYDNTIFVFTGDHIGRFGSTPGDARGRYHLPLLIIAPGLQPGIDERIGSQLDILPTLMDLAGWQLPHASLGRSLLSPATAAQGEFVVNGNIIEWLSQDGWVSHNLDKRIDAKALRDGADLDALQQRLLATQQVTMDMLMTNKVFKEVEGN